MDLFHFFLFQTIVITGIQGGTFSLIVEDSVPTDAFTVSSSGSTIATALRAAALQLSSPKCSYFSASTTVMDKGSSGKNIIIKVQFNVDNSQPLPLLGVFVGDTVGKRFLNSKKEDSIYHFPLRIECNFWRDSNSAAFSFTFWKSKDDIECSKSITTIFHAYLRRFESVQKQHCEGSSRSSGNYLFNAA